LTNLIAILQKPELGFSQNRPDHDDVLGDAYEYLMRHFATESGKSTGQFYTPAEVSRVIAQLSESRPRTPGRRRLRATRRAALGRCCRRSPRRPASTSRSAGRRKDVTTAGLARMNMILHEFPTANILSARM
jgi:type I restriction enzyme M protein